MRNSDTPPGAAPATLPPAPGTHNAPESEVYKQTVDEVLARLDTDGRSGLSRQQVKERLGRYGKNELTAEAPVPAWRKFLAQFSDVLVILLISAGLISAGLWAAERDSALPYEAIAILAIVLLNAVMGYLQQARAEEAVSALRQMSAAQAKVVRGGERQSAPATDLVPGDILVIEEGDTVPADGRLIEVAALQTAEAALTGESLPVAKDVAPIAADAGLGDRHNMIFSGTAATYGHGLAVVTATGMQTQMGHIAGLLKQGPEERTPLQEQLDRVGKILAVTVVAIAAVMIATILMVEDVRGFSAIFDVLILGVALAVAAVPEGLPAVVTAVLSIGVQRMARRNAIVRHLAAVETLGSANVIASDKTGTLTKNEMTVRVAVTASGRVRFAGTGYVPEGEVVREGGGPIEGPLQAELTRALIVADRANNAVLQESDGRWTVLGDPTEGALIVAARKAGLEDAALDARFERIGEVPFSSERKLMSTIHSDAERQERVLALTKGAPDVLLARCSQELVGEEPRPLTEARRAAILACNEDLAGEALRTLGVAARSLERDGAPEALDQRVERDLVFLGLIGMIDPPRAEAREAVARAKGAGIRPIMITGDHPTTAAVIAAELGIAADGRAVTGVEIEKMPDEALDRTVRGVSVYARVNPEHKLRIVDALQREGMTVAMTGDGVNDAPALKTGGHRGRHGHHRHRRVQGGRRHGAGGRQFRHHRGGGGGRAVDLRQHPEVPALPALVEHRRGHDNVLRRAAGRRHRADRGGRGRGGAAAARDADPLDQPGDRRGAGTRARGRSPGRGGHGSAAAPGGRTGHHTAHVARHLLCRRGDGDRDAARPRRFAPRRPDRRLREHRVRADHGLHHAGAVPALQRLQRPLGRAERVRRAVHEPLAMGRGGTVDRPPRGGGLPAVPAAGLLHHRAVRGRLADLRRRGELRALDERAGEGREAGRRPPRGGPSVTIR